MNIQLKSYEDLGYSPLTEYVLWTFQYVAGEDNTNIRYRFEFIWLSLDSGVVKVGPDWDPTSSNIYFSYGTVFQGRNSPSIHFTGATDIFVEFDSNPTQMSSTFALELSVQNISGK